MAPRKRIIKKKDNKPIEKKHKLLHCIICGEVYDFNSLDELAKKIARVYYFCFNCQKHHKFSPNDLLVLKLTAAEKKKLTLLNK